MNTLLQNVDPSIAHALGWTIIHSFWQASLIALLMSLIHRYASNKSAVFKYGVSVFAMASVFILSAITFGVYYSSSSATIDLMVPLEATQLQVSDTIEKSTLTSLQGFFTQNIDHINLIWSVGVILFLARFIFSYLYTKYLKQTAIFSTSTILDATLEKIKNNLAIEKGVKIAESAKINVPIVVGHMKPLILFPIGIVNMLSSEEVEAIITHELAHIQRYDYLTNILLTLIEILFYFHPAVWWISANVKSERENCCDDFALSQNIDKVVYAKALVKLEEIKSNGTPALAMPFSSKKHQLINRIKRIMNMPQTQSDMKEKSIATILLLSMVLVFSNQANSETTPADSFVHVEEAIDTSRISGNEEMIMKVKNGKFESLVIDNEIQKNEFVDRLASTFEGEESEDNYTVTVKKNPLIEIVDDKVHIKGKGGVIYESEDQYFPKFRTDTIPERKNRNSVTYKSENNGKSIEIKKENGEVTMLKIDGKEIPKSDYDKYEEELKSNEFIYELDDDSNIFKHFNDDDFSKSFGLLFDGENWREFGGNMNQIFDDEVLKKLEEMQGMRFDFKNLEELKDLEDLEWFHDFRGLDNIEGMENLNEIFEELGIEMDSTLRGMHFNFDNFNGLDNFEFFGDMEGEDFRFYRGGEPTDRNGTVVEKIGSMLNRDGLLKEYKANKIEITGKHLKINGEKMPSAIFEKYKNIYQESTGAPLTKNSKMVFDVEGKPSNRKIRTF